MSDAAAGPSRRRAAVRRSQMEVRPLTQKAIESKRKGRGRDVEDDEDVSMHSPQSDSLDEHDSLGEGEDDEESDGDNELLLGYEEPSDSEDEYRPEQAARKGGSQRRSSSSRRDGGAAQEGDMTSSGEEFEASEAEWEDEEMGQPANQFDASQSVPTTSSQRLDRARKNQWKPPHIGHGGREGLATWKQIGSLQRSRQAAAIAGNDDGEVEVEEGEIRTLADAFASVGAHADAVPEAQIEQWQRALYANAGADEDDEEEMDDTAFENDLRAAVGFRRKKTAPVAAGAASQPKKRRAPREQALSPEVRQLMTKANLAYAEGDLQRAVEMLEEAVRIEPAIRSAWATLAICLGDMNEPVRALHCRVVAAHLTSHPLRLWVDLAEQSQMFRDTKQQLYCLGKAISSSEDKDRSDVVDIMWERGNLFEMLALEQKTAKEAEDFRRKAAKEYLRMLHHRPHNQDIIRQVVPLLAGLKMQAKAIELLEACAEWNMQAFPDPLVDPEWLDKNVHPDVRNTYETAEIVTLCDLLLTMKRPHEALTVVRKGARWLQGRGTETFWDDIQTDDREFDLERSAKRPGDYGRRVNLAPVYPLDVEFRFRMARARAHMDDVAEACHHFDIWQSAVAMRDALDQYGVLVDEYTDMASRLQDGDDDGNGNDDDGESDERQEDDELNSLRRDLYSEALEIALGLNDVMAEPDVFDEEDDWQNQELYKNLVRAAKCYKELGDYEEAERYMTDVMAHSPDDDSRLLMAAVYEATGRRQEAMALVAEVVQSRRTASAAQNEFDERVRDTQDEALPPSMSLFVEMTERGGGGSAKQATQRGTREQMVQLEALREAETLATRQKTKALEDKVFVDRWWHPDVPMAGDAAQPIYGSRETAAQRQARFQSVADWLADMEGLITMFCNTTQLFLKDKMKRFSGMFRRTRRRAGDDAVDRQARAMLSRMQDAFLDEDQILRSVEHSVFRGVALNEWVDMVMQYAFVLTKTGDFAAAREVIHRVMRSNVVWSNDERRVSLSICMASCALYAGRYSTAVSEAGLRALAFTYQFHPEILRVLLVVGNASGHQANRALGSTNNLKFYLRRSRIHEALVQDAKSAFSLSKSRWVVRDRMFENSNTREEEEEDDEEPTGLLDESDGDSSGAEEAGHAANANNKGALALKRKLATETGTARTIWSEICHLSTIDHVKARPPTRYNPANEMFYAGLLLTSSNGTPSMAYWLRIYARQQSDALVCLACAVACLGRSANRQVDNRHQVVTQAYAMMHFYRTIRRRERRRQRLLSGGDLDDEAADDGDDEAEVRYNFGRAAQHLGLYQLAVPHYRAVLDMHDKSSRQLSPSASSFDCVAEAAFCLHLIYIASGNPSLANAVMERYLRV